MGYSHCLLGAKPLGASEVLRFLGPETLRIVVVIRQTSSRTPFILSKVMTDVARGNVPLRLAGLYALCEFKQPRSGPVFNFAEIAPVAISPMSSSSATADGRLRPLDGVGKGRQPEVTYHQGARRSLGHRVVPGGAAHWGEIRQIWVNLALTCKASPRTSPRSISRTLKFYSCPEGLEATTRPTTTPPPTTMATTTPPTTMATTKRRRPSRGPRSATTSTALLVPRR